MNSYLRTTICAFLLSCCTSAYSRSLPYDAWRLGFFVPDYMEVWIETADVIDIQGNVYDRAMSGNAAIRSPANSTGDLKGWPAKPGWGKGKYVLRADLPKQIYVRWQSLVEPQTYQMTIDIPESTRKIMRKEEKVFCAFDGKWITDYREALVIGLAPGGIAKVWVIGPCLPPIEVTRVQAEVDPRGPNEGKSGGQYDPPSAVSKAYIEKFGVPYGSW
ncbi:DUF2931 family protein [Pseudomonas arsenicoxydans]|uniref:DUF2931 family protein n=1 Tax=Pseudomonas arsenicoxydans TaxID=702115 RepID=A0A502HSW0_9PSED|nr:DUF2931 family protein [Pseudomonas arsenicoxydans]TPG76268.1 DUF2931 family protein [Pseudomonas arsenicoxydans]